MNNSLAGIYLLRYPDGCYVGQSNNVVKRLNKHRAQLLEGIHPNKKLRLAYARYGYLPTFDVLDYCSLSKLNNAEIHWMEVHDCYPNGYNQKPGGGFTRPGIVDEPYIVEDLVSSTINRSSAFKELDLFWVALLACGVLGGALICIANPSFIVPTALFAGVCALLGKT